MNDKKGDQEKKIPEYIFLGSELNMVSEAEGALYWGQVHCFRITLGKDPFQFSFAF